VDVPIMVVGRINHPVLADEIVTKGQADLVCIGRGLLADPEMPIKARLGRLEDIRTCIACNTCMQSIFRKGRIECLVNPSLGREQDMAIVPASRRRKVMVIGGGPGGLNTAWVAASRGHEVHLYERSPTLGGQLLLGSASDFKQELRSLIRFHLRQIEKHGVVCHLGQPVTVATVEREKPEVVVLATGSSPAMPKIPGIDKPLVTSYVHVFDGSSLTGKKTVIIGGGVTGCEAAYHLAKSGSEVTVVEMLPQVGKPLESMTRKVLLQKLRNGRTRILTETKPLQIEDNGVLVTDLKSHNQSFLEAERVVIAVGSQPENGLYQELEPLGYELHRIGDCLEPRSAQAAILEGAVLARSI
jgi:NADPH-dependent 2,4-dienoyl-CoA reductase/sulfur reductase-like enzyme